MGIRVKDNGVRVVNESGNWYNKKGNIRSQEQISSEKIIGKIYTNGVYIETQKEVNHYAKKCSFSSNSG